MSFFRSKTDTSRQKAGLGFLLVGLISLGTFVFLRTYQELEKKALSFPQKPVLTIEPDEKSYPQQISIPSLKINLSVSPAKAIDDKWEISEKGASYLLGSGIPGQKGNVVIYGHNKRNLFGPIRWLGKGDQIKVINRKGEEFAYQIIEIKTVSPKTVEVLASTDQSRLTLYTCTGVLDSKRWIVVAELPLPTPIEGMLGGGISTEAGEVAGVSQHVYSWWWIILLAGTVVLGGFYIFFKRL